jgi:hypothetical protein
MGATGAGRRAHAGSLPARRERGATLIIVAIVLPLLLALAALAIDVTHLYSSRKELQNAADACALAAARVLYTDDGTAIDTGANHTGFVAAKQNPSEQGTGGTVEVWHGGASFTAATWPSDNLGDIRRGHWNFAAHDGLPARTFTPNDATAPPDLWGKSTDELDGDTDFINAVQCVTRREAKAVTNFLAPVLSFFGGTDFATTVVRAEAVALVGFAGKLEPAEIDQPIGICRDTLLVDGEYQCSFGRMSNSGSGSPCGSHQTAGWTDFNQDDTPCTGGTNAGEVRGAICGDGNPNPLNLGMPMATTGGEISNAMRLIKDCWDAHNNGRTTSWELTLPVIACESNNVGTCEEVVGAVTVNVLWVNDSNDTKVEGTPGPGFNATAMDDWTCPTGYTKTQCWADFVSHFALKDPCGNPAIFDGNVVYFKPDCTPHVPAGHTGGQNFGILAKYPALVR